MFKSNNEFNLHIEHIKQTKGFDTYLETVLYFIENESDEEPEQIAKLLNKKIIEELSKEASDLGLLKSTESVLSLL